MKKVMVMLALLGSISFLAGCAMENQKSIAHEETTKVEGGELYTNAAYGFTLTFPDSWKGFTVQKRVLNWGEFGFGDSFDFGFGPENSLFNIAIHTKDQWKKIEADQVAESIHIQVPVGENEKYVFSFSRSHDLANNEMSDRSLEIVDIIKTFQVTSKQTSGKVSGFVSDISFEYPAEFTYSGGGDIDTGSFSWVNGMDTNGKEFTFVTVFDSDLRKCKFVDPALCEIDAWIPASAEDVYLANVENYKKDKKFTYDGPVKIDGIVGEKFSKNSRLEQDDDNIKAVVVIKSKSDVLIFQQINSSASEFAEIIASIKINE